MKKKIYIAYTGGTIGMKKSHKGYIPISGFLQKQIKNIPEFYKKEIPTFTINEYQPLIDSSNITPQNWTNIAYDIQKNYKKYDGFIILHGTDTMSYTASALSFILENLNKPIIITGSQIPLSEIKSDGRKNLLNSLFIAAHYPIHEVTLFFHNKLYRGNRTTKMHANKLNAFSSPNLNPLLKIGINIQYIKKNVLNTKNENLIVHNIASQPINVLTIYPGISNKIIKNCLLKPTKGLILYTYGTGNAPQNKKFLIQLHKAIQKKIIILNLTQCFSGTVNMKNYFTGNTLFNSGIISGKDLTLEAAITKLHFLFSQNFSFNLIKQKIKKNLRGEITDSH
ncbi:asparaginase [Buchnera aphidicola]|uniref:asparaginase n=1 Tax=Buchnera aphidicola TaxID=9 RepID=UPI002237C066|nr:asparaginase [Buchnera aphidicola]MCW5197466.1 asparaginase [Buchnera aphidicola (Chaitophorus viminalis)]